MKLSLLASTRSRWIAALVAIFFFGGCAYIETKQGEWIFNPVQGEWRGYRGPPAEFREQWIPVGKRDEKLHAWWAPVADPNAPVLLYLHGARWNLTGSVSRIPRWNRMGFSVLAIDYRGFGKSVAADGAAPSEASANEDAEAAWKYLATLAPQSKRFIFGHSLGGAMATQVALKYPQADGLILEGTFTSIPDMLKETRWGFIPVGFLVTQTFNSLDRIREVTMPVLVAHGTADEIVPFAMGERLFAAAKAPKRFFRAEGGSHHNLTGSFFEDYQKAVFELFKLNGQGGASASVGRTLSPPSVSSIGAASR
ncbi:MAG: alpha/beta fold hydrolase [Betaproteobacteria bacterium]|nr:alpha/beta fold hydrolase [Betaproteobacteria bacterium]